MFFKLQRGLLFLTFLLILPLSSLCNAEHDELQDNSEPTFIDQAHQDISKSLAAPSQWFDNFFQDPRTEQEIAGTFLRLRGSIVTEEGEEVSFQGKVKAHVRLPNLQRRFHLILSSEDDDLHDDTLKDSVVKRNLAKSNKTTLALQYTQKRSTRLSLTHRVKLGFNDGPTPRIRSRVRYSIPIAKESLLSLTQAISWEDSEGFGEESRLEYDIPFSETKLLRTTGLGFFSESSNGYEWLGMMQWLQSFSHKRALAFGGYIAGETRPKSYLTIYDVFLKYRQRVFKKWLFIELKPEVQWERENGFESVGIFTFTLEAQFGKR